MMPAEACKNVSEDVCGGADFFRADGRCMCNLCGHVYSSHPYCVNSKLPDSMQSSELHPDYALHVLCNGNHVKL
jgi:hypothetical protein